MLGGHVRAVFTLITVIFIVCVIYTITSFQEIPLSLLNDASYFKMKDLQKSETQTGSLNSSVEQIASNENDKLQNQLSYGTTDETVIKRVNYIFRWIFIRSFFPCFSCKWIILLIKLQKQRWITQKTQMKIIIWKKQKGNHPFQCT